MPDAPQSDQVPTISDLVQRRLDQGDSSRELAKRATDAGFAIRHQTISKLAAGPPRSWPEPDTMKALAWLLDTTERNVLLSYGRAFGLAVESAHTGDLIPDGFGQLPQSIQDSVVRLLRSIADSVQPGDTTPVPSVPEKTLRSPRTLVGRSDTAASEQSTGRRLSKG